jgi:hypothetical protein
MSNFLLVMSAEQSCLSAHAEKPAGQPKETKQYPWGYVLSEPLDFKTSQMWRTALAQGQGIARSVQTGPFCKTPSCPFPV